MDVMGGRVVKGVQFKNLRDAGDAVELARTYREEGADELVFLDITATLERRKTLTSLVKRVAANLDIPFTVGGGIAGAADVKAVLTSGADRVSLNTAAISNPSLITELAGKYGSQCVVVAIDAKRSDGGFEVYSHSGTKKTGIDAADWAEEAEERGAGELLVTSMDRDGTKLGYDIELLREITSRVGTPVIASGGCGKLEHFREALVEGGCDAALAASLFHRGEVSVGQVKEYLRSAGVVVRP